MADAGTFEYWQAGEQPDAPQDGVDCGTFEYWQAGEQPPVYSEAGGGGDITCPIMISGWGWSMGGF